MAVWSADVNVLLMLTPVPHAAAVVPLCALVTVRTLPVMSVTSTVSGSPDSAPIVKRFGASGRMEASITVIVVACQ